MASHKLNMITKLDFLIIENMFKLVFLPIM